MLQKIVLPALFATVLGFSVSAAVAQAPSPGSSQTCNADGVSAQMSKLRTCLQNKENGCQTGSGWYSCGIWSIDCIKLQKKYMSAQTDAMTQCQKAAQKAAMTQCQNAQQAAMTQCQNAQNAAMTQCQTSESVSKCLVAIGKQNKLCSPKVLDGLCQAALDKANTL